MSIRLARQYWATMRKRQPFCSNSEFGIAHLGHGDGVTLLLKVVRNEMSQHQEDRLVLEAVDVVLSVRVNALQRLEQLIV